MKRFAPYMIVAFALLVITSCSDDEKYLTGKDGKEYTQKFTLVTGDTAKIEMEASLPIKYAREDSYNVKITTKGEVIAVRMGATKVYVTNGKDLVYLDVTVNPKYFAYPDPFLEFGASRSTVKEKYGEPTSEPADGLIYNDYSETAHIIYFQFEDDKLKEVELWAKADKQDAIEKHLNERFYLYGHNPAPHNDSYYMDALKLDDATLKVDTRLRDDYLFITYYKP